MLIINKYRVKYYNLLFKMAESQENQILDHTFNNGSSPIKLTQANQSSLQVDKSIIKMELSSINRDVNKIQAHLKSLQIVDQERKKFMNSSQNFNSTYLFNATTQSKNFNQSNNQANFISPYNYYGQNYRFQKKIDQLRIDPPQLQQRPKTQYQLKDQKNMEFQIKSQNNQKLSRIADTGLQDPLHFKFPNQNYYIYFQDKQGKNQAKPKISFQTSKNQKSKNFSKIKQKQENTNFDILKKSGNLEFQSQNKPNWILQKKITRMEKQLKQLKKKQQQRQKSNKFKTSKKNDSKININSQVERMINSL